MSTDFSKFPPPTPPGQPAPIKAPDQIEMKGKEDLNKEKPSLPIPTALPQANDQSLQERDIKQADITALSDLDALALFISDTPLPLVKPPTALEPKVTQFNLIRNSNPLTSEEWKKLTKDERIYIFERFQKRAEAGGDSKTIEQDVINSIGWMAQLDSSIGEKASLEVDNKLDALSGKAANSSEFIHYKQLMLKTTVALQEWRPKLWEKLSLFFRGTRANLEGFCNALIALKFSSNKQKGEIISGILDFIEKNPDFSRSCFSLSSTSSDPISNLWKTVHIINAVSNENPKLAGHFAQLFKKAATLANWSEFKKEALELTNIVQLYENTDAQFLAKIYEPFITLRDAQGNFKSDVDKKRANELIEDACKKYIDNDCEQFCLTGRLPNDPAKMEKARAYSNLRKNPELRKKYLNLAPAVKERLEGLIASGDLETVGKLFDRVIQTPNDPFTQRLIAQASVVNLPALKVLLSLKPDHFLTLAVASESPEKPFNRKLCSLIALQAEIQRRSRKPNDLLDLFDKAAEIYSIPEDQWQPWQVIMQKFLDKRNFGLARQSQLNSHTTFWQGVTKPIPLDITRIEQIYNLHEILYELLEPKGSMTWSELQKFDSVALHLSRKIKDSTKLDQWFTLVLYQLTNQPESINAMKDSLPWFLVEKGIEIFGEVNFPVDELIDKGNEIELLKKKIKDDLASDANSCSKYITNLLLTPAGRLNKGLVPIILSILRAQRHFPGKEHIENTLVAIQSREGFDDILNSLDKLPDKGSRSDLLLRATLKLSKDQSLYLKDAKKAALEALFWPLRQTWSGSCFATSVFIQQSSTAEGLKHSLKSFVEIIKTGSLTLGNDTLPAFNATYPIAFDESAFNTHFADDNFLARVLEFTQASVCGKPIELDKIINKWTAALETPFKGSEEGVTLLKSSIADQLRKSTAARYMGFVKSTKKEDFLGAWVIVDRKNEKPLMVSREAFQAFFINILETAFNEQKIKSQELRSLIDKELIPYIKSDQFIKDTLGVEQSNIPNFFGFDPAQLKPDTGLAMFTGGSAAGMIQNIHQRESVTTLFPTGSHPVERLLKYVQGMSAAERATAESNPNLLKLCGFPNHTMNIKIGELVKILPPGKDPKDLVKEMQQKNEKFFSMRLPAAYTDLKREIEEDEKENTEVNKKERQTKIAELNKFPVATASKTDLAKRNTELQQALYLDDRFLWKTPSSAAYKSSGKVDNLQLSLIKNMEEFIIDSISLEMSLSGNTDVDLEKRVTKELDGATTIYDFCLKLAKLDLAHNEEQSKAIMLNVMQKVLKQYPSVSQNTKNFYKSEFAQAQLLEERVSKFACFNSKEWEKRSREFQKIVKDAQPKTLLELCHLFFTKSTDRVMTMNALYKAFMDARLPIPQLIPFGDTNWLIPSGIAYGLDFRLNGDCSIPIYVNPDGDPNFSMMVVNYTADNCQMMEYPDPFGDMPEGADIPHDKAKISQMLLQSKTQAEAKLKVSEVDNKDTKSLAAKVSDEPVKASDQKSAEAVEVLPKEPDKLAQFISDDPFTFALPPPKFEPKFKLFNEFRRAHPDQWKNLTRDERLCILNYFLIKFDAGDNEKLLKDIVTKMIGWMDQLHVAFGEKTSLEMLNKLKAFETASRMDSSKAIRMKETIIKTSLTTKEWRPVFWSNFIFAFDSNGLLDECCNAWIDIAKVNKKLVDCLVRYVEVNPQSYTRLYFCTDDSLFIKSFTKLLTSMQEIYMHSPKLGEHLLKQFQENQVEEIPELHKIVPLCERIGSETVARLYEPLLEKRDSQGNFKTAADEEFVRDLVDNLLNENTDSEVSEFSEYGRSPSDPDKMARALALSKCKNNPELQKLWFSIPLELHQPLLNVVAYGDAYTVTLLLKQIMRAPDDPLTKRLLAQADLQMLPVIKGLLTLESDHPIVLAVGNEPPEKPFSPRLCSLMALQKEIEKATERFVFTKDPLVMERKKRLQDLFEKGSQIYSLPDSILQTSQKFLINCIDKRAFNLAGDFMVNRHEGPFWEKILTNPSISIGRVRQLYNLHQSLKTIKLSQDSIDSIERFALCLAQQSDEPNVKVDNWFGCVQFMMRHSPQLLNSILDSKDWQAMDNAIKEGAIKNIDLNFEAVTLSKATETIKNHILDALSQEKPEGAGPFKQSYLANFLLTPAGSINSDIVPILIEALKSDKVNLYGKNYIERVLKSIQNDQGFSDILENLQTLPKPGSRVEELVVGYSQAGYGLNDVRRVALSALLWPMRQSNAGSCFSTGTYIQQSSTVSGLKQNLKRFNEILETGSITLAEEGVVAPVSYPISFDKDLFALRFNGDHFLARVLEFTQASLHQGSNTKTTIKKWAQVLENKIQEIQKSSDKTISGIKLKINFEEYFQDAVAARFLGHGKVKIKTGVTDLGTWVMVNRKTEEPLIQSRDTFQNLFLNILETIYQDQIKRYPDGEKNPEAVMLRRVIDKELVPYIKSENFLKDSLDLGPEQLDKVFGFNPNAINQNQFLAQWGGGSPKDLIKKLRNTEVIDVSFPSAAHPLESIAKYLQSMPSQERSAAVENQHLLKLLDAPNHILNLKVGELVRQIPSDLDPKLFAAEQQRKNKALFATKLPPMSQDKSESTIKQEDAKEEQAIVKVLLPGESLNITPENQKAFLLNIHFLNTVHSSAALKKSLVPVEASYLKEVSAFEELIWQTALKESGVPADKKGDFEQQLQKLRNSIERNENLTLGDIILSFKNLEQIGNKEQGQRFMMRVMHQVSASEAWEEFQFAEKNYKADEESMGYAIYRDLNNALFASWNEWVSLNDQIVALNPKTIFEFCDLVIKKSKNPQQAKAELFKAISSVKALKPVLPATIHFADTNWKGFSGICYGLDFRKNGDCSVPFYVDESGNIKDNGEAVEFTANNTQVYEFYDTLALP